jgi:hypothetical protein
MGDISDQPQRPGPQTRLEGLWRREGEHYDWRFDSWGAPWRRKQVIAFYLVPAVLGVAIAFGGLALYDAAGRRDAATPTVTINADKETNSPSLSLEQRHQYAARGCAEAAEVGLAPARRGEPGYWPEWDGDNDGVSCER